MNNKDRKRQIAYEVLIILGSLALLTFICRLWPILLLIILGIFVAAISLLFLSGNRVDPVEAQPLLPAPIPAPTERDLRKLAQSLITSRITTLVLNEYPNARWIWEAPNAFELIELGEEVYILLNRAGGYRKAKVIIQNLQVIGLQYQEIPKKPDESEERTEAPATEQPKHNCFNISIHIAEPLASVLYSRMKRLYHTEVWYGRFLLYPLEGGESDVLIAVIIIVTTNHYFIHSMPSWHVAYIAIKHAVKRYVFSLLWWHAKRRHGNGPQTGRFRTG